jgi:hypothetical protein
MTEAMIGKTVRCIACEQRFAADPEVKPPPPPPRRPSAPARSEPYDSHEPLPAPPRRDAEEFASDGRPFCPGCGRRVNWDWIVCLHCGEQFELEFDRRRRRREPYERPRRDSVPHRGPLIANMGNITLAVGALTLCIFGAGVLVTVPLGVTTIVLATSDLGQMRTGLMDPAGRTQTENGRTAAITGLVLSLVFAAGWALFHLSRIF